MYYVCFFCPVNSVQLLNSKDNYLFIYEMKEGPKNSIVELK